MNLVKSIGTLTIGNAISQGIMFFGIIILSRIYSPEEFGVYAVIFGSVSIISAVSSLRYEMTILLPKREKASQVALQLTVVISGMVNLIGLVIVFILVSFSYIDMYWLIVPVAAFMSSIINVGSFLQNRNKAYSKIVGIQVVRSILFVLSGIVLSKYSVVDNGLVGAMLFSFFVPAIFILLEDFRKSHAFEGIFRKKQMIFWARKYRKFFYYSTPAVFVSTLASQAPVFLLSAFMGTAFTGYYSMVQRIVMAPVILISASVNKVYMQSVTSKMAGGKKIYPFTKSLIKKFVLPGVSLSFLMVMLFYFETLEKLLGAQWVGIDAFALVMIPAFFIAFIAKSISGFAVLGRNELGLIYQVVLLVFVSLAIVLSSMLSGNGGIIFMSISLALSICYLGQATSILRISKKNDELNLR